jgi:hypothetical protein
MPTIGPELSLLRDLATGAGRRSTRLGLGGELAASVAHDADGIAHVSGDLERFVVNFVERSPRRDSLQYLPPSDTERAAIAQAWDTLRAGDVTTAAKLLEPTGMQVIRISDTAGGGAVHHAILELDQDPRKLRGLGMFVARQDAAEGALHVQIPHPWDDIGTEAMGTRTYRGTEGATLAIAGASRNTIPGRVADAAHQRSTLFHTMATRTDGPAEHQLQIHGYNTTKHPSYGQAVVSSGGDPTPTGFKVRDALREEGIDARLSGDGRPYINLAGRNNVQGVDSRAVGTDWTHIEFGEGYREDPAMRAQAVAGLVEGFRQSGVGAQAVNLASR